jgi:hypothetical protein
MPRRVDVVEDVESFYFDVDPRLPAEEVSRNRELGRFLSVVNLPASGDGVLAALRDFRIDPALAESNRV